MDLFLPAFTRQANDILDGLGADGLTAAGHLQERREHPLGHADRLGLARNLQFGAPADHRHAELPLDQLDVLVKCAKKGDHQVSLLHLHGCFYHIVCRAFLSCG